MWSLASPFLLLMLALGDVLSLIPYEYHSYYGFGSEEEPFLTLWNIPVQTCVTECQLRNACMAVNYWSQRRKCDMLLTDEGSLIQQNAYTKGCIFIRKIDVQSLNSFDMTTCLTCNNFTACNVTYNSCVLKECRRLQIDNGVVYGNILGVGSRVKIVCDDHYILNPPQPQSVCKVDGSWDNVPTCTPNTDCGVLPIVQHAIVDNIVVNNGSQSLEYTCEKGYAARNTTGAVVQCINNAWETPNLACLRACAEPIAVHNSTLSTGDNLEGVVRSYTCIPDHVAILASVMSIVCQPNGHWTLADFRCVPKFVCPTDDFSFHHAFLQDGAYIQFRAFLDGHTDLNGALTKCAAVGGGLYQILTLAKMTFTLQLMACPAYQSYNFYIDGVYNQATTLWETTAGTPLPMSQDFWYPARPNSPGPNRCVWMPATFGYKWDDTSCGVVLSSPSYALCEMF